MMSTDKKLTVFDHLGELRNRLVKSVIVVVVTTVLAFIFYEQIFDILLVPAQGIELQAIKVTERLGTIMRVSMVTGIMVAMPYLSYQFIMFLSPALTRKEKKYVYLILPWVALMFAVGVLFAYFIVVPRTIFFLMTFGSDIATTGWAISDYISIITRLLLTVGLVFEMPVITTFLSRLGIIKVKWLAAKRKTAVVVAFILAAMITPTIDPISQTLVALPLIALYEMSIWLAKLVQKKETDVTTPVPSSVSQP